MAGCGCLIVIILGVLVGLGGVGALIYFLVQKNKKT